MSSPPCTLTAILVGGGCLLASLLPSAAPFPFAPIARAAVAPLAGRTSRRMVGSGVSDAARDLLYQDQQAATLRRALHEEELLSKRKPKGLWAPKIKARPKSGTGFGGGASADPARWLAEEQAKVVRREGVIRIDGALSAPVADELRRHLLEQQALAKEVTEKDEGAAQAYYGVEAARKHRCDLQLSLLRGGFAAGDGGAESESHPLADALQELLGARGSLRPLYENLVTPEGEFYEMAAVITDPGSQRQMIHPDLPFRSEAPLYVIFLALQDVMEDMGPTSFLLRTHTREAIDMFNDHSRKDEQLLKADCRLATLKKGDAVLFDARLLHCGNGNDPINGSTRAMLNFSFRNPKVQGDLGYAGSIRPGYVGAMKLRDVSDALVAYSDGDKDPFAKYGDGLSRPSVV